jgi:hypothetical protein
MKITDDQWRAIEDPPAPATRSGPALLWVLHQLGVRWRKRYATAFNQKSHEWDTWCQIFTWDAALLLVGEADAPPHWDRSVAPPTELNATRTIEWLRGKGPAHGWQEVTAEAARSAANIGKPTIVTWFNPAGHSHVAMLLPTPEGVPQLIAQAGATNLFGDPLIRGFGSLGPLEYWTHA